MRTKLGQESKTFQVSTKFKNIYDFFPLLHLKSLDHHRLITYFKKGEEFK